MMAQQSQQNAQLNSAIAQQTSQTEQLTSAIGQLTQMVASLQARIDDIEMRLPGGAGLPVRATIKPYPRPVADEESEQRGQSQWLNTTPHNHNAHDSITH